MYIKMEYKHSADEVEYIKEKGYDEFIKEKGISIKLANEEIIMVNDIQDVLLFAIERNCFSFVKSIFMALRYHINSLLRKAIETGTYTSTHYKIQCAIEYGINNDERINYYGAVNDQTNLAKTTFYMLKYEGLICNPLILNAACKYADTDIIKYLVELGANSFHSGMFTAYINERQSVLQLMYSYGADNIHQCLRAEPRTALYNYLIRLGKNH